MKMKPCPECNGTAYRCLDDKLLIAKNVVPCYFCEATGTIPNEPVSHCQACGEPIELGLEWCDRHLPAADLWQALQEKQ